MIAFATASVDHVARADNASIAEVLFREGIDLFKKGHVHDACEKFSESYRLDPANGTLQNLAACHEKEGKTAAAWSEWSALVSKAARASQKERERLAREKSAALEGLVPHVQLRFAEGSDVTDVTLDGQPLGRAAWNSTLPVDPGPHAFEFGAPHKKTAKREITVAAAVTQTLDVPALEPEGAAAPPAATPTATTPAATAPASNEHDRADGQAHGPSRRTIGFVVGGAGILALGAGVYFGLHASSLDSDSQSERDAANRAGDQARYDAAKAEHDRAVTSQLVGLVSGGAGLVALGIGAYLVLAPEKTSAATSTARLRVRPTLGRGLAGLDLGGSW